MSKLLPQAERAIRRNLARTLSGPLRQRFHFMPQSGWMNDPNGLIFFRGQYHLFYQTNPYAPRWSDMYWGHAVSNDLLRWRYLPLALAPDEPYESGERGGCFSGSAVEWEGRLYLFYTAARTTGGTRTQSQCMAWSDDGVRFHKSADNPVIPAPPKGWDEANFRDPKVWRHDGRWYMACGATCGGAGAVLLYASDDLTHWAYQSVLLQGGPEEGWMWECPDVFSLGDKTALCFSPMAAQDGHQAVYRVGTLDYGAGAFRVERAGSLDAGPDFYAMQSFAAPDGRRLALAWAGGWPWMSWYTPEASTKSEGWRGAMTLPRELRLSSEGEWSAVPARELDALRAEGWLRTDVTLVQSLFLPTDSAAFELRLLIDRAQTDADALTLCWSPEGDGACIALDWAHDRLTINRAGCPFHRAWRVRDTRFLSLWCYIDRGSVELFIDEGQTTFCCNLFPTVGTFALRTVGGSVRLMRAALWPLRTITNE